MKTSSYQTSDDFQKDIDCWVEAKKHLDTVTREYQDNPTPENGRRVEEAKGIEHQAKDIMGLQLSRLPPHDRTLLLIETYKRLGGLG